VLVHGGNVAADDLVAGQGLRRGRRGRHEWLPSLGV
jgi:hypothetical protein